MSQTHFGFTPVDESEKAGRVRAVFDSVASKYDLMNDLMSLGAHRAWKAYTVAVANVRPGDKVGLALEPANAHWFDARSEHRLA